MPIRTCVGCQQRDEQEKLMRWVAEVTGRIKIDERRREAGRGAWTHPVRECLQKAAGGGFARSLRRRTQHVDVDRLWELVEESKA